MELECDLSTITNEELLRKMWQQSEDSSRKKDIRSQLYKLRESRLRDLYQGDIMSDNTIAGFGKDPLAASHGDALADQSFQSLKSKEIRDSMSPTEMKFQSMALNHPSTTGWNVQSSKEMSPDGRGFRTETVATTDGVENVNGGTAEFKGRNEQRSSAHHQGDDKNFVKKAMESSNSHLQEKVVLGDENSGSTEVRTSSSTSTSSSQVFQSSSNVGYDDRAPIGQNPHHQYLMDHPHRPHHQQEQQYHQEQQRMQEEQRIQEQQFRQQHQQHINEQQERRTSEQLSTSRQNTEKKNTLQNVQTQETHEQNKRYVDMDKASPEYQQHVQHLMQQPGEIISQNVEYPKPNVKMITTVKKLPDGTIVRNKRYETEELPPTTAPSTKSTNQTNQRRDSPLGQNPRRPTEDVVDNTTRYTQDTHSDDVETKFSSVKKSSRKFSTESTSETIQESTHPEASRIKPVTNDFSTHGFPSVKSNKPTHEYPTDRPQGSRPSQAFPSQPLNNPSDAVVPHHYTDNVQNITERRIPTKDGELIIVSSEKKRNYKHQTNSERIIETEHNISDDQHYQQISDKTQDFTTHGFPSAREPLSQPKNYPEQRQMHTQDFPMDKIPPGTRIITTSTSPNEDVVVVSSQKSHTAKNSSNTERIIEHEVVRDDQGYPRIQATTNHTVHNYTVTTPGDQFPGGEFPGLTRKSPSQDYSTQGFPSVRSPNKTTPYTQGYPTNSDGSKPNGAAEPPRMSPTKTQPRATSPNKFRTPNTTRDTTERVIRKEKEVDSAHRAFAASLRSSSPADSTRRDSSTTDSHVRYAPRSSVSSTKTFRRDMREGSHDSAPSETSRVSTTTVTRQTPPRTVAGKTTVTRVVTTKTGPGSNETIDVTSPRATKSPSPGKTVTTTTTTKTITSKTPTSPTKEVPKSTDNQHTRITTTNKNASIFPINEPLTITKINFSDNHQNNHKQHPTNNNREKSPTTPLSPGIIEEPCLKKQYYLLGPSDQLSQTTPPYPYNNPKKYEKSPRKQSSSPQPPAPSSRTSTPSYNSSKLLMDVDDDDDNNQPEKPYTTQPTTSKSSPLSPSRSSRTPKPIGPSHTDKPNDEPLSHQPFDDERRTVNRETTFEKIENLPEKIKPSYDQPNIEWVLVDDVDIAEDEYNDDEDVDFGLNIKRTTKKLLTHEKNVPVVPNRRPQMTTDKVTTIKTIYNIRDKEITKPQRSPKDRSPIKTSPQKQFPEPRPAAQTRPQKPLPQSKTPMHVPTKTQPKSIDNKQQPKVLKVVPKTPNKEVLPLTSPSQRKPHPKETTEDQTIRKTLKTSEIIKDRTTKVVDDKRFPLKDTPKRILQSPERKPNQRLPVFRKPEETDEEQETTVIIKTSQKRFPERDSPKRRSISPENRPKQPTQGYRKPEDTEEATMTIETTQISFPVKEKPKRRQSPESKPKNLTPSYRRPEETAEDETITIIESTQTTEKQIHDLEEEFINEPNYPDNKIQKLQKGPKSPHKEVPQFPKKDHFPAPTPNQRKPKQNIPVDDQTFRNTLRTTEILTTTMLDDEEFPEEDSPYGRRQEDRPLKRKPGFEKPTETDEDETFTETSVFVLKSTQKRMVSEKQIQELEEEYVIEPNTPENKAPKNLDSKKPQKYPKEVPPTPNKDVSPTRTQKKPIQKLPLDDQTYRKSMRTTEIVKDKTTKSCKDEDFPKEVTPYKKDAKPETRPKDHNPGFDKPTETDEDETFTETSEFVINSSQKRVVSEKQVEELNEDFISEPNYPDTTTNNVDYKKPEKGHKSPNKEFSPTRIQKKPDQKNKDTSPKRTPNKSDLKLPGEDQTFRKSLRTTEIGKETTTKSIEYEDFPDQDIPYKKSTKPESRPRDRKPGFEKPTETDEDETHFVTSEFIIKSSQKEVLELEEDFISKPNYPDNNSLKYVDSKKPQKGPRSPNKDVSPTRKQKKNIVESESEPKPKKGPKELPEENSATPTTSQIKPDKNLPVNDETFRKTLRTTNKTSQIIDEIYTDEKNKPKDHKPGHVKPLETDDETSENENFIFETCQKRILTEKIIDNSEDEILTDIKKPLNYTDNKVHKDGLKPEESMQKKPKDNTPQFATTYEETIETIKGQTYPENSDKFPENPKTQKSDTFKTTAETMILETLKPVGEKPEKTKPTTPTDEKWLPKKTPIITSNINEQFIETERVRTETPDGAFISKAEPSAPLSPTFKKKGAGRRDTFEDRCRQILGMETYGDTPGTFKNQSITEKMEETKEEIHKETTTHKEDLKNTTVFQVKIEDCGDDDDDDEPLSIKSVQKTIHKRIHTTEQKRNEPVKEEPKFTTTVETKFKPTEIKEKRSQPLEPTGNFREEPTEKSDQRKPVEEYEKTWTQPVKTKGKPVEEPKQKAKQPSGSKRKSVTKDDDTENVDCVKTNTNTTIITKTPRTLSPGPKIKPTKGNETVQTITKTTVYRQSPSNKPLDDTDDTSEQETYISSSHFDDTLEQIEVINKQNKKSEVKVTKKFTTSTSPRSVSPTKETKILASPKRKPSTESVEPKSTKTSPKKQNPKPDSDTKTSATIKDRLRSSTRKTKSPTKHDQVDGSGSSPEPSPTRISERRRSSNISVNTEIIIEHMEVQPHDKKEKSPGPKRPHDSVFREIIDSTVLPDKLTRKMLVTERKESAPVHRVTHKDNDSKMSRSTSEKLIKVKKPEHNTLAPKPVPKSSDHRRPNKCFATKSINLTTTDRLVNSKDMESVIIDIQHAKSSREPSPDKIVPTPVPAHLDTGKPRYPDVVQEPEDEQPRRKPQVKNIPIFEEENNSYVGCHITEINVDKSRKTTMDSLDYDHEILNNPLIEAPPSLDYPSLDKPNADECLLTVHEKVSKFQHIAEEVKKPKPSSPFNREFDESTTVPDNDECLLSIDEKVDKFLKTAENVTKPLTPSVRAEQIPYFEDDDEEFERNERIYSSIKLAPSAPQKSPDLVRTISRHISRISDVEPCEEPLHSEDDEYTHATANEDFVECLVNNTKKTTKEFVMTHHQASAEKYQQTPHKRNVDHDDDDDVELIPHTATHTTVIEQRRQKDILTRPSVLNNKNNNNKKPNATTTKTPLLCTTTPKPTVKDLEKLRPDIKSRTKPTTTAEHKHLTEHQTKTSAYTSKQRQSPQRKHSDIDYELRAGSGSNNVETGVGIISKQTKVYNNNKTTTSTGNSITNDLIKSTQQLVNKKPEKHIPVRLTPATNLDENDLNTEQMISTLETTTTTSTANKSDSTTVVNGKNNKEPFPLLPHSTLKKQPIAQNSSTNSSPLKIPNQHVTTKLTERSTLKHNLDITTSKKTESVEYPETIEPVLEATKRSPYTPKTTKTTTMDTVAARRSLFENKQGSTTPTQRTPLASPLPGRRPSYMDHTKSSLEHTRRDSLEINKTNYSRKPSQTEDDVPGVDRNSMVKFNVPQAKLSKEVTTITTTSVTEDINIEEIFDLEVLEQMLETVTSYELRRRIRAQIRIIKKNQKNDLITTEITTNTVKTSKPTREEPENTTRKTKPFNGRDRSLSPIAKTTKQFLTKESETHSSTTTKKHTIHNEEEMEHYQQQPQSPTRPTSSPSTSPHRYHHEDSEYIRDRSPDTTKKPVRSYTERSHSPQEKPACARNVKHNRTHNSNHHEDNDELIPHTSTHTTRIEERRQKDILSRPSVFDNKKANERSQSPQGKPVRNAAHNRPHTPETKAELREYGSRTTIKKQYLYKDEEAHEEVDQVTQETPHRYHHEDSEYIRDRSPDTTKKPMRSSTERSHSPQEKPACARNVKHNRTHNSNHHEDNDELIPHTSTHTTRIEERRQKDILSRPSVFDNKKPNERSQSPQGKPVRNAAHNRPHTPETKAELREYGSRTTIKKQYLYKDEEAHEEVDQVRQETRKQSSGSPTRLTTTTRKSSSPRKYPSTHSSPERRDSSPESKKPLKNTERSRSPQGKTTPSTSRVYSHSPDGKISSTSHKSSATYEQSLKTSSTKQPKRVPVSNTPNKTKPEEKSAPVWIDRKNLLKTPSSTTPKKPAISTLDSRSGFTKTIKSTSSQKMTSSNKSSFVEDDCITSSYGIGPTDENGLPLFGIRALKKKKPTTEPCETTEEVTGYVVEEKYYSDNKTKPIVERKELIYSTNPEQLEKIKKQVNGSTTRKSLKDAEVKETCQTALISKTTPALRSSPEDDFLDSSTKYVRRGSVKEMSEKFIHRESSSSITEKSSYPKAGLILRTNSRKNSRDNDTDADNYDSYKTTRVQHSTFLADSDDAEHEYEVEESDSLHSGRLITESESECESVQTQREFKKVTSSSSSSTRSFLNTQGEEKVITNVSDCLERMRNADNVIEEGDTTEDQEARALLNKFLGASIIMKGVESSLPPSSNRQSKIITTTTTNNNNNRSDGNKPAKHEVKTTRITKTIKSGSSSSPVIQTTCDIEEIGDEEILKELLEQARTYEERRKIRSRLRELMADREEKKNSQAGEKEVKTSPEIKNAEEEDSSASEYEEIIDEVTDYSESEAENEDKNSGNKEAATTETEVTKEKENPKVTTEESQSEDIENKSHETVTKKLETTSSSSEEETVIEEVTKKDEELVKEVATKSETDNEIEKVEGVKVESIEESDDKTDNSEKGESLQPLLQDILHQATMPQGGTSQQSTNSQKLKSVQSSNSKTTTTTSASVIKPKTSSETSSMHAPYNKTSATAPTRTSQNPIVTVQTAGRADSTAISNKALNSSSSSSGSNKNSGSVVSNSIVVVGNNSPRQVDRLGVPQKEDSGTESGEDLRLIAAGLRDQLQIQSDSNIIEDVTCALSRLESSLKEGKDISVDLEKRKALLALVARLQAGLTSPEKLAEIAAAMYELDGNEGLYGETSSPEADAHRSNRSRFAKRRSRINRHTVGVSREELADARRYMEDMMLMGNISQSTTPEANNSNNNSPPQWYPIEKNASIGALVKPPSPSILQRPKQFVPEETNPTKNITKLSVNNGNKRRPLSGEYSVSFEPQLSYNKQEDTTKITSTSRELYQNVKQASPTDDSSKFARFSNKKHLMKRANTIDIAKTQKYNSEFDTDSDAEDKGPYLGLKRTVQVSVKKRVANVVPPFEPKTENDRKFLAFINKQSDKPGLGWTTSRSVSNWSNKFGSIKNTFEGGLTAKPPQVPHHAAPSKPYHSTKLFIQPVPNNSAAPFITTNQQIAQRLKQEAERQAEERRRKLEREHLEYERRERDKLERQRQQRERQERERLEREYFERQRREQDQIAAAQHAAILREQHQLAKAQQQQQQQAANMNAPQPMAINEFKHAPQSVFRPIDNGEAPLKTIYKPIPQLPMNSNNWQSMTSLPRGVSNNLTPTSPNYHGNTRPDNSFITSPTPSSRSPIGLPWASKPTVDSSSFKTKANRFEERSKYDNIGNTGGPFLQRNNSLRSGNGNSHQGEEFRKRPSLPNTCDPYIVNHMQQRQQEQDPLAYLPPPQNISFTYSDLKPNRKNYQSYPCIPTAVINNAREPDYHRSRDDSLTDPHSVPLVLTTSNPSYCPPQQQLTQPPLPRQFDIVSPLDSARTSPSVMLQTDCTDDDIDSDNLLEYHAVSRVMAKPQCQTAVTVGRRTGHASDDEIYGKNSRAARNLLSTMKNLGNPNTNRKQQKPATFKRSEQVTSPNICLSPDGRSYQAPIVEPLFPEVTNFEANRTPLYVGAQTNKQAQSNYTSKYEPSRQNIYNSLENLNAVPPTTIQSNMAPMQQPAPQPAKPYLSETQSSYVVTYPTEETTDDEDYSRHSQRKMNPPSSLDLRRQRNISENSTGSSTTASISYSHNLPSPNTSWTANPIMSEDYSNYQNVGAQYQSASRSQPQVSVKSLNQSLADQAYTYQGQSRMLSQNQMMPTQPQTVIQQSPMQMDYMKTSSYEAPTMSAQQYPIAQTQQPQLQMQILTPPHETQSQRQVPSIAAQQIPIAQTQQPLMQQHIPTSSYETQSQMQLPTMTAQQLPTAQTQQPSIQKQISHEAPPQRQQPTMAAQQLPIAQTKLTSTHEVLTQKQQLPTAQYASLQKKTPASVYEAQPQRQLQNQTQRVTTQKQTSKSSYDSQSQRQIKAMTSQQQQPSRSQKPAITQKPTDYQSKQTTKTSQTTSTTAATTQEKDINKKSLTSMRKSVSVDHHNVREQMVINPQNSNISQEMITKLDQQRERINNEIRRKSLGNALDYQMEKQARYETQQTEIYKSSAPSDTPDIVKSSLPKDENQPLLKKFGPPQRHHYIPNAYQSPGTNVTRSTAVSNTMHSTMEVSSSNKAIYKSSQQQIMTNTRPAVVDAPTTPQPDDDYIPRNIVFNNVHAFTSMSRRQDEDTSSTQEQPQMRPNKLGKSDSWNQIIQLQNQHMPPPSPKFNQSPTNELRRTKSGHTLALPKMYEAAMVKADISEKQKTVASYFSSGQKSPTQQEVVADQQIIKRSVINRTKTSEKVSASRKSLGSNLPIAPGGLTRSATMPHIGNLNLLDESNVEDAFEQLIMDQKQHKSASSTTEKTETKEKDGAVVTTTTKVTTRTVTGSATKPVSPFAKFKQLDGQNSQQSAKSPTTPTTAGGASTASPSSGNQPIFKFTDPALNARAATVKDQLLQWCQMKTQEYENIEITNFSTSWNNGLAFCALIHHFLPDAFDYSQLTPKNRRKNFELAFTVADEKAGIAPLLDVEDMVVMQRPDWKCVFIYVQSIYRRFRNCQ